MGTTIEVRDLTKRYGPTIAVDDLTFSVLPGRVTGFVGPNGAGKSTTMRVILGLAASDTGTATVGGEQYVRKCFPLREVGVLLDASATHPGRRARDHLLWLAQSNDLPRTRIDEVLELVGLSAVAGRRTGGFSLGMAQRLGIAAALLGDPPVLMLDEPVNGLDPEGIVWIRGFLRSLASEGRTVFVSSHLMSELQGTADHLVVIGRGRLIADASVDELLASATDGAVGMRTPDLTEVMRLLASAGATVVSTGPDALTSPASGPSASRNWWLNAVFACSNWPLNASRSRTSTSPSRAMRSITPRAGGIGHERRHAPGAACRVDEGPVGAQHDVDHDRGRRRDGRGLGLPGGRRRHQRQRGRRGWRRRRRGQRSPRCVARPGRDDRLRRRRPHL
jgi:ABC-2 type transport system ATP-binding protein